MAWYLQWLEVYGAVVSAQHRPYESRTTIRSVLGCACSTSCLGPADFIGKPYGEQLSVIYIGSPPGPSVVLTDEQLDGCEDDGSANEDYAGPIAGISWTWQDQCALDRGLPPSEE